jgi:glucose/arabinose dehydrogenase
MLDLALDRRFAINRTLYFCYTPDRSGNVRLARARLANNASGLEEVRTIFNQQGPAAGGANLGCRIAQGTDNALFVTMGDHFKPRDDAQNLANDIGKLVRIDPDGQPPGDNPFIGRKDARPEIWSYGHRNGQGLAFNPASGVLWEIEHGPRGGDEVNIISKGKNYGWPVIGYGIDYDGSKIHESTAKPGMEQPIKYWVPSIAPSGMAFYTGTLFPQWRGSLFTGALAGKMLVRLSLDGDTVTGEERLLQSLNERIRDVRQGPDGALWLLTDNSAGRILRISPATK